MGKQYPALSEDKWKQVYSLAFNVTLDTKLRAFQYKFLNRIVYTNEKLFAFKITDSPLCTFCKKEVESTEHLFFSCKVIDVFWKEVLSWMSVHGIDINEITLLDVLFGNFDPREDGMVLNHIILLAKFFIYRCKLDKINPSLAVFKAKLKAIYKLETFIARKNDALLKHFSQWSSFISAFI